MRDIQHHRDDRLPPPMPRTAAHMTVEDFNRMGTDCFRIHGEIDLRRERAGDEWAEEMHTLAETYHGLILALMTLSPVFSQHSRKVTL